MATFADFIFECQNYEHSQEHYELMKECSEVALMDQYLENQNFIMNLNESYDVEDGYFSEAAGSDTIENVENAADTKKKNLFLRIIDGIVNIFRKIGAFFSSLFTRKKKKVVEFVPAEQIINVANAIASGATSTNKVVLDDDDESDTTTTSKIVRSDVPPKSSVETPAKKSNKNVNYELTVNDAKPFVNAYSKFYKSIGFNDPSSKGVLDACKSLYESLFKSVTPQKAPAIRLNYSNMNDLSKYIMYIIIGTYDMIASDSYVFDIAKMAKENGKNITCAGEYRVEHPDDEVPDYAIMDIREIGNSALAIKNFLDDILRVTNKKNPGRNEIYRTNRFISFRFVDKVRIANHDASEQVNELRTMENNVDEMGESAKNIKVKVKDFTLKSETNYVVDNFTKALTVLNKVSATTLKFYASADAFLNEITAAYDSFSAKYNHAVMN